MEKQRIIRNVLIKRINTVVSNVEIRSIDETMIQFRINMEQYEVIENNLISIGASIQMLSNGEISVLINKRHSDFSIVKNNNNTYNNVCNAIQGIEWIKDNNNVIFNNSGLSSTEAVCRDSLIIALDYLKRAKEALRDLGYNR